MRIFVILNILCMTGLLYAQMAEIPLDDKQNMPAQNLIYQGQSRTSDYAKGLLKDGIDLSELNPKANSMWGPEITEDQNKDQELKTESGEHVYFKNIVKTNDGLMRFDALRNNNSVGTYYLDPRMHLTHLRKHFLRKLGYKIPAIKRLKTIHVHFETKESKDYFIQEMEYKLDIIAAKKRWIISQTDLSLELRDLSQIKQGRIISNYAMGLPSGYLGDRTQRALLLVYALLDLDESVNKVRCDAGKRVGTQIALPYFFGFADFSSTHIDDLRWMGKRLASFNKADFHHLLLQSHFPRPVADILAERIICRKQHLLKLINISFKHEETDLAKDTPPYLVDGKIKKRDWTDQGYATRFAGTDAPSPFKDFHMLLLSMFQSIGIDSLIGKLNSKLQTFDPQKARFNLAKKEFERGLDHFIQTGEFLQFPISAWASPVLDGRFILSRDVIIGNYLGTDNLVQLADTFGYSADAGVMIGFENIKPIRGKSIQGTSIRANATFTKTFTHLKPIQTLKTVFKEPYRNMIVPLIKRDLRKGLEAISKLQDENKDLEDKEKKNANEILNIINKSLGVGESLLITQRFNKSIRGSLGIPNITSLWGNFLNIRLGFGPGHIGVSRLHIMRRNENTLQIFDDRGNGITSSFNLDLSYLIPVLRVNNKRQKGKYSVKYLGLNITPNKKKNPDIYKNVKLLENILLKNNFSIIEEKPEIKEKIGTIDGDYLDKDNRLAILPFRNRRLRTYTKYDFNPTQVDEKDDTGNYVSYRDHRQRGVNWESFAKDIINYYMVKFSQDVTWANRIWLNPSDSILGASETLELDYEAFDNNDILSRDYISVTERLEGWSKNEKKLIDFAKKLNKKHKLALFSPKMFEQMKKINLYDIFVRFSIYERGVKKFKNSGADALKKYAYFYEKEKGLKCENQGVRKLSDGRLLPTCGYLGLIINNHQNCSKKKNQRRSMRCWTRVVRRMYKKFNVLELARFFGRDNIYIYARVNGFRKDSEHFYTPEVSDGFGEKDPRTPEGIISLLQRKYSIPSGEFEGFWLRSRL